eukprot:SAG25_NODE_2571_length_1525_cov_5.725806_2_plen_133_part_01
MSGKAARPAPPPADGIARCVSNKMPSRRWVPVKVQLDVESYRQELSTMAGQAGLVGLKARAVFRAPPSVVFDMVWDAEKRPTWDRYAVSHSVHERGCHAVEQVGDWPLIAPPILASLLASPPPCLPPSLSLSL